MDNKYNYDYIFFSTEDEKIRESFTKIFTCKLRQIKPNNKINYDYINEYFSLSTLELIEAGDYLISKYPEWKWCKDEKDLVKDNKIPKDKVYLKATFNCSQRVRDYINSISNLNIEEEIKGNDEKDNNKTKEKIIENKMRIYDVYIAYDFQYYCPRIWFMGYDCNNKPLNFDEIKEDIMPDNRSIDCTIEVQPFNGIKCMSINPSGYLFLFKRVLKSFKEKVFIFLLNCIHSIIPTIIRSDYGQDIILNL
jgi:ubiquitin-like-conjugating enzyme ATG3